MCKSKELILETRHLNKSFPAGKGRCLTACDDVSLRFYKSRTLGVVGESGCGKTTLMRMVVGLEAPSSGEVLFHGENRGRLKGEALRQSRRQIQMVFQDPTEAFHPKMKVKEIICEPLLNFKRIDKRAVDQRARELLGLVELSADFAERSPRDMSGGQRQRIGIARALALEPEVIICDEATSALDVSVQKNIIELLVHLQREKQIAMGFVCHDLALLQQFAHQIAVMYLGSVVELIDGRAVAGGAKHPYTQALLGAVFDLGMDFEKEIEAAPGESPNPLSIPRGCRFQGRCPGCRSICRREKPALTKIAPSHWVACHAYTTPEK